TPIGLTQAPRGVAFQLDARGNRHYSRRPTGAGGHEVMRVSTQAVLWVALIGFLVLPPTALAQSGAIAGQITDATGAVLPGVTVEATSPALISGSRTVVSDGQGRYSIEQLVPGTYKVIFSLTGFSTLVREGIE